MSNDESRPGPGERQSTMSLSAVLKTLWAAPCTAVGMLPALLICALGGSARAVTGVLEVAFDDDRHPIARALAVLPFSAITLGRVVIARTHACQRVHRSHERIHVAQYERWGPLFFVLYAGSSCWQLVKGGRPYFDNHFERQARFGACDGGPPHARQHET